MDTNTVYMENSVSIFRDEFKSRQEYLKQYRELCHLYDFKVRVVGGWMFFRYISDYLRFRRQVLKWTKT